MKKANDSDIDKEGAQEEYVLIILIFGVSNVGKTSIGRVLARKLNYSFFDLDEEIKKHFIQHWKTL